MAVASGPRLLCEGSGSSSVYFETGRNAASSWSGGGKSESR